MHFASRFSPACVLTFALALAACGGGVDDPPVPPGVISLAVGEGRTLTAAQAATIEVSGGSAGAEFVLVPFNASQTPSATVALEFSAAQITGVTGPPLPQLAPRAGAGLTLTVDGERLQRRAAASARFHGDLRRLERTVFARRMPAARAAWA